MDMIQSTQFTETPTQYESKRLLELFSTHMSVSQHFLDHRAFDDSLTLLFRPRASNIRGRNSIWFAEYLLVMAIGKLIDERSDGDQPPGASFFAEAVRRLPPHYQLGAAGVTAVEVLALIATYLQWIDKKHDAYLYVGMGVRLALALGYSQPCDEMQCLPSEAAHRVRLFWTLYMLDRRLASSLGLPVGVNNQQIKVGLPKPSTGFPSPTPLCINIRIAHTTGEIMCLLYGNTTASTSEHVQRIEDIMRILREIFSSIPTEYKIDLTASELTVSRTGASLHLMLFQAILLCLRPIVLQEVRLCSSSSADAGTGEAASRAPSGLIQSCQDAAKIIVRILSALKKQNLLARFGFFDLDATFSAAFILVMTSILDGASGNALPNNIKLACDTLRYFSSSGNRAARQRLEDVAQFCSHIWSIDVEVILGDGVSRADHSRSNENEFTPHRNGLQQATGSSTELDPGGALYATTISPQDIAFDGDLTRSFHFDFEGDTDGIFSSFNNSDLILTGIDHADWMEMERILNQSNM
ncbi:hypothetical protein K431DRAFT_279514 [Polychaeton citri CBS 116435]|uniref:Xylanolytic transcriptional activator regulatory domain-containing protein n=1 Tax=Polychaeton citri CBS 116435 TaxID=1314669 RepID=A0A9P4PYJ6_9PEZI|nr:hypothetical protein K431DRAFT_279514 [Polychaeton citri CBS 116435]